MSSVRLTLVDFAEAGLEGETATGGSITVDMQFLCTVGAWDVQSAPVRMFEDDLPSQVVV